MEKRNNNYNYENDPTSPILKQPPPYPEFSGPSNTQVIIQMPNQNNGARNWSSGLFSCFDDLSSCCCVLLCPCCMASRLFSRYGECCCTSCVVPHPIFSLRVQHRNRHKLAGSMCNDCCTATFCWMCATCQLSRDMDYVIATKGTLAM